MENLVTLGHTDLLLKRGITLKNIKSLNENKTYKKITSLKPFRSYCNLYVENIEDKDSFYEGLLNYCEKYVNNFPKTWDENLLQEFVELSEAIKDKDLIDKIVEASNAINKYHFTESDGVGYLSLKIDTGSGLKYGSHGDYEYIPLIKQFIKEGKPLYVSKTKSASSSSDHSDVEPIILDQKDFVDEDIGVNFLDEDNEEFAIKLIDVLKGYGSIQKPKVSGEGKDFKPSVNLQEGLQAYIIQKYWNNPFVGDDAKAFIDDLLSSSFYDRVYLGAGNKEIEDLRTNLENSINKNGKAYAGTWLAYFILEAKEVGSKIRDLFSGALGAEVKSRISKQPEVYSRALKSDIDSEVNRFFSANIAGKQKDLVNKADILLNFDGNVREFFDNINGKDIVEYCNICDAALSNGSNIGVSLKKGEGEVHVALLAGTTSINKDVFGDNAAISIDYYGEDSSDNTLKPIKEVFADQSNLNHISFDGKTLTFAPFKNDKGEDGRTCNIHIPINSNSKLYSNLNGEIILNIRSNGASVTVEAQGKNSKAAMGKLVTPLAQLTDTKIPKNLGTVDKINFLLGMISKLLTSDTPDHDFAWLIATTGYPFVDKTGDGASKLQMAPIIKIS